MSIRKTVYLLTVLLISTSLLIQFTVAPSQAQDATFDFTTSYKAPSNFTSRCTSVYPIVGKEPATPGTYPVFIHLVGSFEHHDNSEAIVFIEEMAKRGYVAASVDYAQWFASASTFDDRARCIYNGTDTNSAVAQLCARAKADCSRGIITSGFSFGAWFAARAANHEARVQAVYALGLNDKANLGEYLDLLVPGSRTLPNDRLRIISGASSAYDGDGYSERETVRMQLNTITGLNCAVTAESCLRPNGSGWYMVQDTDVQDGKADHCYFRVGTTATACSERPFDIGWIPLANNEWSLSTNLDWLTQFITSPSPSPSYRSFIPFVSNATTSGPPELQ